MNKKGQGISINTIIIAAIALVVLVVLIAIFTGRFAIFQQTVSEEAKTELAQMQINYGNCHPDAVAEQSFLQALSEAGDAAEEASAKSDFQRLISVCKTGEGDCSTRGGGFSSTLISGGCTEG